MSHYKNQASNLTFVFLLLTFFSMDNDQQNLEEATSCIFFNISREAFPTLICSCTACLASLSEQDSTASAAVSLFSGSEDNTTSVYPQSSTGKQPVTPFLPTINCRILADYFDTQSESFFSDYTQDSLYEYTRADNAFAAQNEMIKPFELTTRANVSYFFFFLHKYVSSD